MVFTFIILHYKALQETIRCIESIKTNYEAKIFVLDNGSNDGSGIILKDYYNGADDVIVLISEINFGFSKGNNFVYKYIKENKLTSDFIVACNNDLIFTQAEFLDTLINIYESTGCAVVGPDIRDYLNNNNHQSPLMMRARSLVEIENYVKEIKKKERMIPYIVLKESIKRVFAKTSFKRRRKYTKRIIDYGKSYRDVVLSGACLIFTPRYFECYDKLFYPETFFYHEEEILYYKLKKNNMFMYYTPELWVEHDHSVSTSKGFLSLSQKLKFQYSNNINSCKVLIEMITEN